MSGIRYEDLPEAMKRQVDAQTGSKTKKRSTRKELSVKDSPTRCHACEAVFPRYTQWERHCDESSHCRSEVVL